jgi:hypothetical protein
VNNADSAAKSFFLLARISELLDDGHRNGCELKYKISRTSGYEIHINIDPPTVIESSAFQSEDPIKIDTNGHLSR